MKEENDSEFSRQVGSKEKRKLRAIQRQKEGVWFGFSMFGLVGWSVVTPTLLGALLGHWIDKNYPSDHSWTLALLVAGLMLGSFNAWNWVQKESKELQDKEEE